MNTQIVFFADREKIICHLYNTTQLILVNRRGYRKFIELFLKPFLSSKIYECLDVIEEFNDEVVQQHGPKTVKRSNVKLNRGPIYSCHSCEFAAQSAPALKKHKKLEHLLSFNSSRKMEDHRQSTRNNSGIENLLIEDVLVTDLGHWSGNLLEEISYKVYTHDRRGRGSKICVHYMSPQIL